MKLNTKAYLLAALLLGATRCASGQVLTLDSVLALIERNNPSLKEYDNRVQALHEYAAGAKSWMAPMVGAGTFMVPYANEKNVHEADKGAWMFTVEQDIPNPAKLNA
ncbi:MAG: TolC family protein, partial [Bacteroidota bacterium]|nr:TolC family protein [Bacteroidota bacterium]